MIVVDASALLEVLLQTSLGARVEARLFGKVSHRMGVALKHQQIVCKHPPVTRWDVAAPPFPDDGPTSVSTAAAWMQASSSGVLIR